MPSSFAGAIAVRNCISLSGNLVYAACQWGVLIILAKVGSAEMVGQFALGLAVAAPILMLTNLQLRPIQATDVENKFAFSDYLGLRLLTSILALAAICVSALTFGLTPETANVVIVVGIAKCVESISDVLYGQMQRADRMDCIATSMMIKGPLSLAAMAIAVWSTGRVLVGAAALGLVWLLLGATYDLGSARRTASSTVHRNAHSLVGYARPHRESRATQFTLAWRPSVLGRIVRLSLPMGLAMMLLALATSIPKYFVQRDLGESALGYFSALAYPGYGISLLVAALGQSASTRLARAHASDGHTFGRLLLTLGAITLGLGAIAVVFVMTLGREILNIIYRPEYASYANLFTVLTVASVIWSIEAILGYGATASKVYRGQAWAGAIAATVTLVSANVLIKSQGLLGAGLATACGGMAALSVFVILILRRERSCPII